MTALVDKDDDDETASITAVMAHDGGRSVSGSVGS